ncbi:peptidoglycan DD-metalloendopeptidase family protein [Rhodospirillales bacterium]|nr:peptidoglycan DD-metalloendopeptidase family protein [Rhodospirillales bacterium]
MRLKYVIRRLKRLFDAYLPDRELIMRTDGKVWFVKISKKIQIAGLILVIVTSGWGIFSSFSYFAVGKVIEAKDKEILKTRIVYRGLLSEISNYQSKFTILTDDLEENHESMLDLVEKNANLQQNLSTAKSKLVSSKRRFESELVSSKRQYETELVSSKRQYETELVSSKRRQDEIAAVKGRLKAKLKDIEQRMRSLNTHNFELKGNLSSISGSLENALAERNSALMLNERLNERTSELLANLDNLQNSEKNVIARLTRTTVDEISVLEKFISRTGIQPKQLIAGEKRTSTLGQGGPFVEVQKGNEPGAFLKSSIDNLGAKLDRLSNLKRLVGVIPFSPPLEHFSISSHFGKRRDPINKRWAMHYGLDLTGFKKAKVYATAPGKVVKSGYKGKYGKFIEIDHGDGFKTRYGHLYKTLVKRGQEVKFRQKIGLLGNSGRSTGSHLHYEVTHNGKQKNPWRFIKAGKYVYKN